MNFPASLAATALLALALQDKGPKPPEATLVLDRAMDKRWTAEAVEPAPAADDAEYFRRLSLDLRGFIPGADEVRAFLDDPSAGKRAQKVEDFLAGEAWPRLMTRWFAQILFENPLRIPLQLGRDYDPKAKAEVEARFFRQLESMIAKDAPVASILRDLLEAQGKASENPLVFYKLSMWGDGNASLTFSERVAQGWMGIKLSCARCHDHPFDQWTQEHFYGLAGFFARQQVKLTPEKGDATDAELVDDRNAPDITVPETSRTVKPTFLFGGMLNKTDPRMPSLVAFISKRDHNQLARNFANRLWGWLLGRALVHPADDFNQRNRPSNPELLNELTKAFAQEKTSLKQLTRAICASKAYQRASARTTPGDAKDCARMAPRPMTAGQLFLSCVVATQGPAKAAEAGSEELKKWRGDWDEQMKQVFGPGVPWNEVTAMPDNPRQALMLRNSRLVQQLLAAPGGLPAQLAGEAKTSPAMKVEVAFESVLGRFPRPEEASLWTKWAGEHNDAEGMADLFWTLMNSTEFSLRH